MRLNPLSLVGGILGFVSLALPWFALTVTVFGVSVSQGIPGYSLFGGFALFGDVPAEAAGLMIGLMIGPILVLVGSIISIFHWGGGGLTMGGGIVAFAVGSMIAASFGGLGASFAFGPSFGVYLAIVGGALSLFGGWWWASRHKAPTPGAVPGTDPSFAGNPAYGTPNNPNANWQPGMETANANPGFPNTAANADGTNPNWDNNPPANAVGLNVLRACPTCGTETSEFNCPNDGTQTNPVEEPPVIETP